MQSIRPEQAHDAGYRAIEVAIEASRGPVIACMDAAGVREADRLGWEIVGKWDEQQHGSTGSFNVRTFWCRERKARVTCSRK